MVSVQDVYTGEVDRISGSSNAMVRGSDITALAGSGLNRSEVNLGPLPRSIVGQEVVFAYTGGTYGICIEERWVSSDYTTKMRGVISASVDKIEFPNVSGEENLTELFKQGEVLIPQQLGLKKDFVPSTPLGGDKLLAKFETETGESTRNCLGIINGLFFTDDLQLPVVVTEVHQTHIETRPSLFESDIELPKHGEKVNIQTHDKSDQGTIGFYEENQKVPVLLPGAEYPLGETIDVEITDQKESHLVADVTLNPNEVETVSLSSRNLGVNRQSSNRIIEEHTPIDVRTVPKTSPETDEIVLVDANDEALVGCWNLRDELGGFDIQKGSIIELHIDRVDENEFIGTYQNFPVRCECTGEIPPEFEGEVIRVEIRSLLPDRAEAVPDSRISDKNEAKVEVIGISSDDALAIVDGQLVRIPNQSTISVNESIHIGFETDPEMEAIGSVNLRSIFDSEEQIIRIPNTVGEIISINGTPVFVGHLPDIESPITLGVEKAHSDHVVPTVTALPSSHIPESGRAIAVSPESIEQSAIVGVSAELPIELPPLPAHDEENIRVMVITANRDAIFGAIDSQTEGTDISLAQCYAKLQIASSAYENQEYQNCIKALSEANESLPGEYLLLAALLTANQVLIQANVTVRTGGNKPDMINEMRAKRRNIKSIMNEAEFDDSMHSLLEAYIGAIGASEEILTALDEVDEDIQSKYQAIARGATATEPVNAALADFESAKNLITNTKFDNPVAMSEVRWLIEYTRENFPYPIDKLKNISPPEDRGAGLRFLLSRDIEDAESILQYQNQTGELWEREETPDEMGVFSVAIDDSRELETPVGYETDKKCNTKSEHTKVESTESIENGTENPAPEGESRSAGSESSNSEYSNGSKQSPNQSKENRDNPKQNRADTEKGNSSQPNKAEIESTDATNQDNDKKSSSRPAVRPTTIPNETAKLKELRQQAEQEATENPRRSDTDYSPSPYQRSDSIKQYALERADGVCEVCGEVAPFDRPDGTPYLEVHHVNELGEGGADHPSLVAALCPTCHKNIHYGKGGEEINDQLRQRLENGLGDVGSGE